MRGVPIDLSEIWPGSIRRTIGSPPGVPMDQIPPIDAVLDQAADDEPLPGHPRIHLKFKLEPGELEKLGEDPHVWISLYTSSLPPIAARVGSDQRTSS